MLEGKTTTLSKLAICLVVLGLIFILEINVMRDATIWKEKMKQIISISQWDWDLEANSTPVITCNRSSKSYDLCTMSSPTLLDQTSLTLSTLGPNTKTKYSHIIEKIKPYPLKNDENAMARISEYTLTSAPPNISQCGVTHHSPALIFSAGGYNGNFYHEINENIIPLFITINFFFHDQNVILVAADGMPWWFQKYDDLLSAYSPRHKIINTNNLTTTHCFPSAIVGLIKHGPIIIDPKLFPHPKTLLDFHAFLKKTYLKKDTPLLYPNNEGNKPLLTLVTRKGNATSRVILNQEEVIKEAEDVGFNVHVFEPSRKLSMAYAYRLIHSSHVMLGVHGAGLTHLLFLKQGSVIFQVVPIGLNWASETYYNKPHKILGLEYVEYKIEANESSLAWEYGADSLLIKNPSAYTGGKWDKQRNYLKKQNVKIDIIRFRKSLIEAYKKAKKFMDSTS